MPLEKSRDTALEKVASQRGLIVGALNTAVLSELVAPSVKTLMLKARTEAAAGMMLPIDEDTIVIRHLDLMRLSLRVQRDSMPCGSFHPQ
ncbi:hypothetical protein KM043_001868 [Ampulex compressa]|nr:hypothetical protein KM043_001868 [Ampulex compressa]